MGVWRESSANVDGGGVEPATGRDGWRGSRDDEFRLDADF
jgi:hypothetical protein